MYIRILRVIRLKFEGQSESEKLMASWSMFLTFLASAALFSCLFDAVECEGLRAGFYKKTCPKAEAIVRKTIAGFVARDATLSASLLRLQFHDCFVRGCDGSLLLNATKGNPAEKDAGISQSLVGFSVIDAVKENLEAACPGVVSCADIVALAARDGVVLNNGPRWKVETGRRDGRASNVSEPTLSMPLPSLDLASLKENFARQGLNLADLVILSGSHTIGVAHCISFSKRLYNFTGKGDADPSLSPAYARQLRKKCKPGDVTTTVDMDRRSAINFDTNYFRDVINGRGLFVSDAVLLQDDDTKKLVYEFMGNIFKFFDEFSASMIKMGRIGVLTGEEGEIRRHCALVND